MNDLNNLQNMAPEDIFRLSFIKSKLELSELCKRMTWGESFARRVFAAEKFFPSFQDLPRYCSAVGNNLIIDWLVANTRQPEYTGIATVDSQYLTTKMLNLCAETGGAVKTAQAIIADEKITKTEKRKMIRELLELVDQALQITGDLKANA